MPDPKTPSKDDEMADEDQPKPGEAVTEDTPQEDIDKLVNDELGIDEDTVSEEEGENDGASGDEPGDDGDDSEGDEDPADSTSEEGDEDGDSAGDSDKGKDEPDVPEPGSKEDEVSVKTEDLFIEVEDSEGKKHKLTLEGGVPDKFTFRDDKQLFEILRSFQEMEGIKSSREKELEEKAEAKDAEQAKKDQIAAWDEEIDDLMEAGLIVRPKSKAGTKEFAEDEAVKKVNAVMEYMTKQNEKRLEDKKAPITSFGTAFTLYEKAEAIKAEKAADKKDNDAAKEAGSKVGGGSAASSGGDEWVYERGSAKSIYDVKV